MVHRARFDKTYLSLGLLSPLSYHLLLRSLFCLFLSGIEKGLIGYTVPTLKRFYGASSILARPDDTSSRSLAFRPLHHG